MSVGVDSQKTRFASWTQIVGARAVNMLAQSRQRLYDSLDQLGAAINAVGGQSPLVVVDKQAVRVLGIQNQLTAQLADRRVAWFDAFAPNPRHLDALQAARAAAAHGADLVIAIGGGSCQDVGKMASLAARRPDSAQSLVCGHRPEDADPLPIIAFPTTSGTGSEATHFAAIYVDGRKTSVAHAGLRPRAVVLDPQLHVGMPAQLAAVTGLDALGQAMESRWAVGSTPESMSLAEEAGRLSSSFLVTSVKTAGRAARLGMMVGAHLAGQAINISKTTAAHALSYELTQRFGLPHGHAVALTLGYVAAANAEVRVETCLDSRGCDHVRRQVEAAAACLSVPPAELPARIETLLRELSLPATLAEVDVDEHAVAELARAVDPVRLGNNPRLLTEEDLRDLLQRARVGACA